MPPTEKWKSKFQIKSNSWVFVPNDESVRYGKEVKLALENRWSAPDFYYHLKDGGHVKALKSHTGHQFFIHLDIKDFFGSINRSRITRCLKRYFGYTSAREIAEKSTVMLPNNALKKYILPFGFVQSPIIASICLDNSGLSKCLYHLSKTPEIAVSIYVDDIIISGNDSLFLKQKLSDIKFAAIKSGFALNPAKEEGPSDKITAFNIELSHEKLKLIDSRFNEFIDEYKSSANPNQHKGIIGYISSVNPTQADDLQKI